MPGRRPASLRVTTRTSSQLSTLQYDDLCGQPGDASRICNIDGVVVSLGDFDNNEAASGLTDGTADREAWQNCLLADDPAP